MRGDNCGQWRCSADVAGWRSNTAACGYRANQIRRVVPARIQIAGLFIDEDVVRLVRPIDGARGRYLAVGTAYTAESQQRKQQNLSSQSHKLSLRKLHSLKNAVAVWVCRWVHIPTWESLSE